MKFSDYSWSFVITYKQVVMNTMHTKNLEMEEPFEIKLDNINELIEIRFRGGHDNYEMRMQCIENMAKAMGQSGYNRMLVDLSKIVEPMSIINQFTFGEGISQSELRKVKTAVVHNPKSDNPNDIITLVSGNRGRDIRDFSSREKAVDWLQD